MLANGGLAVNDCSFLGQLFLPFLSFPFTFLIDLFSMCFFPLYAFLSHSFHYALELLIALLFLAHTHVPLLFTFHCSLLVAFSLFSLNCIFQSMMASSMLLVFLGSFIFLFNHLFFHYGYFFGITIVVGSHSWVEENCINIKIFFIAEFIDKFLGPYPFIAIVSGVHYGLYDLPTCGSHI